ncbi:MAG: hypothetical protein ACRDOI_44900 [Trebonia sp.]
MGWQPGEGQGAGVGPGPDPGAPRPGVPRPDGARDPRLAGFAEGGEWDSRPPSAALALALEEASGPGWRCPGAEHDELIGALRASAALESRACAAKLGLLRALMREENLPLPGGDHHGDLPDGWSRSLTHEVSLALAMPAVSAEKLMWTAWDLEALLPGIGALVDDGTLTYSKARAVDDALLLLSEEDKARAEALILPHLAGKTYGQIEKIAVRTAGTVDPGIAERNREHAERNRARVVLKREQSGAAMLSGYDLPPAETLAAHARVCARAVEYKESGVFPGVLMDQLRGQAYLDLMNGITAEARVAAGPPDTGLGAPNDTGTPADASTGDPGPDEPDEEDRDDPGPDEPNLDDGPDDGPDDGGPGGPSGGHPDGGGPDPRPGPDEPSSPAPPRPTDLVIPLATLLGLARRPGDSHGFGPLDPILCRDLAALAASSPHTTVCVTVVDEHGFAIGHGCLRPGLRSAPLRGAPVPPLTALPARMNLTIAATRLAGLAGRPGPPSGAASPGGWAFARHDVQDARGSTGGADPPGKPDWCGTWAIALPGELEYTVRLEPVPTWDCEHQRESHAYQPNDKLRHLVQIRDHECTFPTCSRHGRESDFEHAIPYHKGGRTCACNAGARSRSCHRVKQSPGWKVTQPKPGWHQWETPSGRVYVQEPWRYPS